MHPADLACWMQVVNSLVFWPSVLLLDRPGKRWLFLLMLSAFICVSAVTFALVMAAPNQPELFLKAAPDGEARSLLSIAPLRDGRERIGLRIWRRDDPDAYRERFVVLNAGTSLSKTARVTWDSDCRRARLATDTDDRQIWFELELP